MKQEIKKIVEERLEPTCSSPFRQTYHIMADIGWISDPNGLCQHNGIYHIFHQYTPAQDQGLSKAWGHYTTKDWIHYIDEGCLMVPDQWLDKSGCYSGSGYSKDGKLHLFYTGNVLHEGDYDYIYEGRGHYVNTLSSENGIDFSDKECLLKNEDYPKTMSCHVRDPKVFEWNGAFYIVLGARSREDRGCALLYKSKDLKNFTFEQIIHSKQPFGYMWECPDLFSLDGKRILLCCPQGIPQEGIHYENIYQNGWFELEKKENGNLEATIFHEFDHGFDFYAPQTMEDEQGRRILIGWMGMPDAEYSNPEFKDGWIHCLTLPRELKIKDNTLYQFPIQEILDLKENEKKIQLKKHEKIELQTRSFALHIEDLPTQFELKIRSDCKLSYQDQILTLSLEKSGAGRKERHVQIKTIETIDLFSDESSLEIFINRGETCLTTRIYDIDRPIQLASNIDLSMTYYDMKAIQVDYSKVEGK